MAESAPRCPLDAKMTGIKTACRVSSRSPVRLCAAVHETATEGKGGGFGAGWRGHLFGAGSIAV